MYVLYAEHGSKRFSLFLELLGDEVGLQGWQNFRGGLDVKREHTHPPTNNPPLYYSRNAPILALHIHDCA